MCGCRGSASGSAWTRGVLSSGGVVLLRLSLPGKSVTESGLHQSLLRGPGEVWRERGSWLRLVVLVSVSILPIVTDQPEQREGWVWRTEG